MEVILLETFDRLGKIGDVVKVKDGFARNFLIPQQKALRANKSNKEYFSKIKNDLLEQSKKAVDEANSILKKIQNKDIIFIRNASDNGQLYGSVSPKDISHYFLEQKLDIKPSNINLHSSIKKIGIYDINVKLHAEVSCILKINVATSEENAKIQKDEVSKPKKQETESLKNDSQPKKENTVETKTDDIKKENTVETKTDDIKKENLEIDDESKKNSLNNNDEEDSVNSNSEQ